MRRKRVGVRYLSSADHDKHGWLFTNCKTIREAELEADKYLLDRGLVGVTLMVTDYRGYEIIRVTRD